MAAGQNPYARPTPRAGEAPDPTNEFIWNSYRFAAPNVPNSTDPEWTTGFSPSLRSGGSPDGSALPDDIRTGHREPPINNPNDHEYNARRYSEFHKRHRVEFHSESWQVQQRRIPAPRVPLWEQERAPIRPTAERSPSGYLFTRPWHIPRHVQDAVGEDAITHLSLADHRRKYEIFGMRPQGRLGVNTYRASVRPWDDHLYVPPAAQDTSVSSGVTGNRSYRL